MITKDYHLISPSIPQLPGVYRFIDARKTIIYVGKAKSLKKRLSSYFGEKKNQPYKTRTMVKNAVSLEYTVVDSEADALLLENTLIKKYQPRYNVMLKDSKSYTYLCVKNEHFPRVFFTRKVVRDGSKYFGPYTSKYKTKQIFEIIQNLFPIRTCNFQLSPENIDQDKFKVCLEYHLKNCMGPCQGYQDEEAYDRNIEQVKNILRGNFKPVKEYIRKEMNNYSLQLEFENAAAMKEKLHLFEEYQSKSMVVSPVIRDVDVYSIQSDSEWAFVNYMKVVNGALINSETVELKINLVSADSEILGYTVPELRKKYNSIAPEVVASHSFPHISSDFKITIPQRGHKKNLLDLSLKNVKFFVLQKKKVQLNAIKKQTSSERILKTLQDDLHMTKIPFHIECFDNSNIQGTHPVASCVVFKNGRPSKKDYRKFKIKTVEGPDDFASMEEVVYRRYKRMIEEKDTLPQLIIIDGGKGQLKSAMKSVNRLSFSDRVTVIGIAKRLEEIYFHDDPIPLYINKKSESLKLIQQARNEAHRFAISYHRNKRSKEFIQSGLTAIIGIGEKTSNQLLEHFGSMKRIKAASEKDLSDVIGNQKAKLIHDGLNH